MTATEISMQRHAVGLFVESMRQPTVLQSLLDKQPQHEKDERRRKANQREARRQAALDALRPKLTPEFMATLAEAARVMGYRDDDYNDVAVKVVDVFGAAGLTVGLPEHEPLDFDLEQP